MNAMYILEAMTDIDSAIIENAQPQCKPKGKTVTRILLLAALIAALTMTAFAAGEAMNWFRDYFARHSEEDLSDSQITFIEENTTDIQQSQTCNGYTITVESAFSDGVNGFIKLKLTAPEGIKLDATCYYPGNTDYMTALEPGEMNSWELGWRIMEDDDGKENTVSLLCTLRELLEDRSRWEIHIEDLYGIYYENAGEENYRRWTELISEGIWDFDITFSDAGNEELELITEPVDVEMSVGLEKNSAQKVKITSLKLRAMSAQISYEFLEPTGAAEEFSEIFLVMKDGTMVLMYPSARYEGCTTYRFRAPVILFEADHVLLPDGTELPIPKS